MNESKDHDLLIELRTEVKGLRQDVRNLTQNTAGQIATLQKEKLDADDFLSHLNEDRTTKKDHEQRLRSLESAYWRGIGALAVIQIVAQLLISQFLK